MKVNNPAQEGLPKIGIVGGGISGICAARACLLRGLNVTLFEKRSELGGIWSSDDSPIFDALTTNTATFETCISDIPPSRVQPSPTLSEYDNLCYTAKEMTGYIQSVVKSTPGLVDCAKLKTDVLSVKLTPCGTYRIVSQSHGVQREDLEFDKIIISTGYFDTPFVPSPTEIPGIHQFKGKIMHVSKYKNPTQLSGKHVLIVGGSISGCEAAGDMVSAESSKGPESVTLNTRSMRFLLLKQRRGEVLLSKLSSRFQGLRDLAGRLEDEQYAETMCRLMPQFLSNSDFPAPKPDGPIKIPHVPCWVPVNGKLYEACQSNKIQWKVSPIECIGEECVRFKDGSHGDYDTIVCATGYKLSLPFLERNVQQAVLADNDVNLLDLCDYTFHPDVPNMAFVGMYPPGSAFIPMVDNQSRWVARVFSGSLRPPTTQEMKNGVQRYTEMRSSPNSRFVVYGFDLLDVFAKNCGFEIDLAAFPQLTKALLLGPLVPAQFRLFGDGHSEDALNETMRQFEAAGFEAGDNVVNSDIYEELRTICQVLSEKGVCPPSLPAAIETLVVSEA